MNADKTGMNPFTNGSLGDFLGFPPIALKLQETVEVLRLRNAFSLTGEGRKNQASGAC